MRMMGALLVITTLLMSIVVNGVNIMPLGDSITYGCGGTYNGCNSTSPTLFCGDCVGGYRTELYLNLTAEGLKFNFVGSQLAGPSTIDRHNEGHPGWRIDQVADNISQWIASAQPDVFLVHLGTNDVSQGNPNATVVARMENLLSLIYKSSPSAVVYVATIIERFCDGIANVSIPLTNDLNAAIPNVVSEFASHGYAIKLVDMYHLAHLNQTTDYADGCVHPNVIGYAKMANVWASAILSDAGKLF